MTVFALGDSAAVISLGDTVDAAMAARVRAVAAEIERHCPAGVVDVVPAFASIAVFFEPHQLTGFDGLRRELELRVQRAESAVVSLEARTVEVPVCYSEEFGPDLGEVAAHAGLSMAEVVALHAPADYLVHAIGFAPGFPYLGGMPAKLATPRRATPRLRIAAGSVGIGGAHTGIYPFETPGGWNIIGRTPRTLFDASRRDPALLRTGDRVRFRAISAGEFQRDAPPGDEDSAASSSEMGARGSSPAAEEQRAGHSRSQVPGIAVIRGGMFTTVQDLGRRGHRASGVPLSGAADPFALRVLNLLVGNAETAAGLEYTLVGPELRFLHDTVAAFGGGDFGGIPRWRPIAIPAGTGLKLGAARSGCRGYLAVAGGIDVPRVLGSHSTYVRAKLGGMEGRVLRDGDVLPVPAVRRAVRDHWSIDRRILPAYSHSPVVRIVRGMHSGEFPANWTKQTFKVSSRSDRMGMRLMGEPVPRSVTRELLSSPVAPGTIQVPPDGQPIVLLADAQTIGGYPQVAHVISTDLPLVAQLRPSDPVQFREVTLAEAGELLAAQERALALLREGVAQKLVEGLRE